MPSDNGAYEYKHELEFISGLGKWSEHKFDRADLIASYTMACTKRVNWINIKKDRVFAALQRELAEL
jgi:hypothetical protein